MDGTEAEWPTDAARVPKGLTPERAWRWCVLRTVRDYRLAIRAGRYISRPVLERLFCRRWGRIQAFRSGIDEQE